MVNNKKKSIDEKVNNSIMPEPHGEQAHETWKITWKSNFVRLTVTLQLYKS